MTRILNSILFSCTIVFSCFSQGDIRFRNYTINDGLSQSSVTCIVQDELSTLWFGTQDGLNRFDGSGFEVFLADETEGLESSYINCSYASSENVWFGTNNGLTKYDVATNTFETYPIKENNSIQVVSISSFNGNLLWLATSESGLYIFNTKTKESKGLYQFFEQRKITGVYSISENKALVTANNGNELFLIDKHNSTSKQINLPSDFIINKIINYENDKVVLATNRGVYEYDYLTEEFNSKFENITYKFGVQNITDILYHNETGWYLTTRGNGLFWVNENNVINHITEDIFQRTALLFNDINVVFRGNSGTIWLGSNRGVSSFHPLNKGFLGVGPSGILSKGIPSPTVWSFDESTYGDKLFIGTDEGVSSLDKSTGRFRQFFRSQNNLELNNNSALAIKFIKNGQLLVGCADGLFELTYDYTSYRFTPIDLTDPLNNNTNNRCYSIVHFEGDEYFIGTKDGAVLLNLKTGKKQFFSHEPRRYKRTITKGICRLVYRDREGKIWFATSSGGLSYLKVEDGENIIVPYEYNSKLKATSKAYFYSIFEDHSGNYWLGSSGEGLIYWNTKTLQGKIYNKSNGLPNDVIYSVLPDNRNHIWMSTNKGICSMDLKTKEVISYTEEDGLMSNEFNLGASYKSKGGLLYFGGIYGYNYFSPSEINTESKNIIVNFSRFKLGDKWVAPNEEGSPLTKPIYNTTSIFLKYNQRSFTLRFQSNDLSNPERVNYKYNLIGSEEGEIEIGRLNEIHFNSLSPGNYTLEVYARIGEGEWSELPSVLDIHIDKPYWLKWWFWTILAFILTILIRWIVKNRIDQAKRGQVILEMKVKERTREIEQKNIKIESQKKKIEEERNKVIQQQKLLQREKDRTEKVLRNVIPASTAEELKKKGRASARAYKVVSVLFTDFVGFTKISETMTATELVKKLDVYFKKFDEIIIKNNLEKIKTIGDAYMCAGGVPVRNKTNPIDACLAAIQIQSYMNKRKLEAIANNEEYWELRLGINTGEVTAGVIGNERLAYDIWGATVNQAQYMEMNGSPGKVVVSGATHLFIEPYFVTLFIGKIQSKSKGLIDMFLVEGIKPELSLKGEGIYPNKRFHEIVNLHHFSSINYYKAERHIMKVLEQQLSSQLHYHSIGHTLDVVKAVERLALLEGVTDEGLFLLKSAATYHDAGFVEQYDHNEPVGVRMAEEILPKYGYTPQHIKKIADLIYVTKIPHNPKNKLEEIICDADLDYLGRDDFHEIADRLRVELREHGKIDSDRKWDEIQVQFLTSHKYFTKTAKKLRKAKKEQNLKEIKQRLKENKYKD